MHIKTYGEIYLFNLLLSLFIDKIEINFHFYVLVRAYEKSVPGKQPYVQFSLHLLVWRFADMYMQIPITCLLQFTARRLG